MCPENHIAAFGVGWLLDAEVRDTTDGGLEGEDAASCSGLKNVVSSQAPPPPRSEFSVQACPTLLRTDRTLPPMSVPTPSGLPRMPNNAPSPPLLPPAVRFRLRGQTVVPR
jgi:hypothetical protein